MELKSAGFKSLGAPVHYPLEELLKCVNCERYVARDHRFCRHCGRRFRASDSEVMAGGDVVDKVRDSRIGLSLFLAFFVVTALVSYWLL